MLNLSKKVSGSFRDPSGFLFYYNKSLYRQINNRYKENYDYLIQSGLYQTLLESNLLIPHEEIKDNFTSSQNSYKVIKPDIIPFISYPYEWSFTQLKDAALTTLEIQRKAIEHGMSLKDASAYNIQFKDGKPILIDTLSFEKYSAGQQWPAYKQFCQHFLAPLALISYVDARLNLLFRVNIDGIPLDLVSKLLPFRTKLKFFLSIHLHLHAKTQKYFSDKIINIRQRNVGSHSLLGLVDNLISVIKKLKWHHKKTEWSGYYSLTNYSEEAFEHKKYLVCDFLDQIDSPIETIWDLGANTGIFSLLGSKKAKQVISFDYDPVAVEKNYRDNKTNSVKSTLPLILDLANPSPALGWAHQERISLKERGPADVIFALALIHHLSISNNVPFTKIADFFSKNCSWLIIEFIPKSDPQIQKMLATREDIFAEYQKDYFEKEFSKFFTIIRSYPIKNSKRIMYLMRKTRSKS